MSEPLLKFSTSVAKRGFQLLTLQILPARSICTLVWRISGAKTGTELGPSSNVPSCSRTGSPAEGTV